MSKKKYYAVRVGKTPGIYFTWADCSAQVTGFKGAKYKSFQNIEEALEFVDLVFDNDLDKVYFLRQYIKNYEENFKINKAVMAKRFVK